MPIIFRWNWSYIWQKLQYFGDIRVIFEENTLFLEYSVNFQQKCGILLQIGLIFEKKNYFLMQFFLIFYCINIYTLFFLKIEKATRCFRREVGCITF